jgi:hypothetical protein
MVGVLVEGADAPVVAERPGLAVVIAGRCGVTVHGHQAHRADGVTVCPVMVIVV